MVTSRCVLGCPREWHPYSWAFSRLSTLSWTGCLRQEWLSTLRKSLHLVANHLQDLELDFILWITAAREFPACPLWERINGFGVNSRKSFGQFLSRHKTDTGPIFPTLKNLSLSNTSFLSWNAKSYHEMSEELSDLFLLNTL